MSSFFQREMSACTRKCHHSNNISHCSSGRSRAERGAGAFWRLWVVGGWGHPGQSRRSCQVGDQSCPWRERLPQAEPNCRLWAGALERGITLVSCPVWVIFILIQTLHSLPWKQKSFPSIRSVPLSATADREVSIKREWTHPEVLQPLSSGRGFHKW